MFSVESSAKQFRQGMRFPRYLVYTGYSLPRRDRLNQFQLPLYTLTRFRGRISKVCKATDLDFHGNLDALRLPSTILPSIPFAPTTLLTQFRFLLRPTTKLPCSVSYSFFYYPPRFYLLSSREDNKILFLRKTKFVERESLLDRSPSKGDV